MSRRILTLTVLLGFCLLIPDLDVSQLAHLIMQEFQTELLILMIFSIFFLLYQKEFCTALNKET